MKIKEFSLLSCMFLFFTWNVNAQSISKQTFKANVENILNHPQLASASVSIHVINTENNEVLYSYDANRSLCPASTMKLFTTSSALLLLGENFNFSTKVAHSGNWENGIINGNLYLIGSGDPSLTTEDFPKINFGKPLTKVTGDLVGIDGAFNSQLIPNGWIWEDIGNYYGAGTSGLNINQNKYNLYLQSFEQGKAAKFLSTSPALDDIDFHNEVVAGAKGSGDQAYIYGSPRSEERYIRGTIPPYQTKFRIKGSLPDPSLYAAKFFNDYLKTKGIQIEGDIETESEVNQGLQTIGSIESEKLPSLVKEVNFKSNNLYAECLAKTIANQQTGMSGGTKKGTEIIQNEWINRGLPSTGFYMVDGSGLSRVNSVTSKQMSLMLSKMTRTSVYNSFKNSLPIVGQTGTVKYICRSGVAKGKIHAKSGSMKGVLSYAGYAQNLANKQYAFAIIINNYDDSTTIKPLIENFFNSLVSLTE